MISILGWHNRYWHSGSHNMETDICVGALEETLAKYGTSDIVIIA